MNGTGTCEEFSAFPHPMENALQLLGAARGATNTSFSPGLQDPLHSLLSPPVPTQPLPSPRTGQHRLTAQHRVPGKSRLGDRGFYFHLWFKENIPCG